MGNYGTGATGNEDLMFSLGLDGITLVDQLEQTEQKVGDSLKKIGGHFQNLKAEVDSAGASNAFKSKITGLVGPVSALTAELRALVSQLRQVNSLLTGMSGAGAPAIIKATGAASAAATVAAGKAAAASIDATGRASAAATAAAGKASAAATVATAKANQLASNAANQSAAAARRAAAAASAASSKIGLSGQTLNQQFQQTGGYLRNISTVLSTLGLGGGIFALIYGFKQLVKERSEERRVGKECR